MDRGVTFCVTCYVHGDTLRLTCSNQPTRVTRVHPIRYLYVVVTQVVTRVVTQVVTRFIPQVVTRVVFHGTQVVTVYY